MKMFMLTTALVATTAVSASAQDLFRSDADPMSIRASDFIGMRVYAAEADIAATEYAGAQGDWQDIGEINDVIISRDGSVDSVLVDVGGFLGIGERQVAVSMPQVRFVSDSSTTDNANDFFLVVQAPRAMIEGAPAYSMNETPMDARKATDTGMDTAEAMPMTTDAGNATAMDDMKAPVMAVEGYNSVDLATLTAENLIGATVYGGEDNSVGTVSDVRIGAGDKIDGLIVDVGGFLGIGSKPVAVPLDKAQVLKDANGTEVRVYVPMSKDDLTALPEVKSN